jgi:uncharacterized membrane protein YjfL (UPF0719 family)
MFAIGSLLFADLTPWAWDSFALALLSTTAFGLIGIMLAIVGFKLFDYLTPGNLEDEIIQKQNLAAAILGGAIVLGICLIVSRAVS